MINVMVHISELSGYYKQTNDTTVFYSFVKKHTYANARKIQGIRLRTQIESIGLNEQLPVSPFQRDAM